MNVSVRSADGVILQYGENIGDLLGCVTVALTSGQYASLLLLIASPNGGIILNADGSLTALPPPAPFDDPKFDQAVSICKTYYASTAPTAADTVTALKALMYIVRGVM